MFQTFRIWEDFAALLNLLQVTHPLLPEKMGKKRDTWTGDFLFAASVIECFLAIGQHK